MVSNYVNKPSYPNTLHMAIYHLRGMVEREPTDRIHPLLLANDQCLIAWAKRKYSVLQKGLHHEHNPSKSLYINKYYNSLLWRVARTTHTLANHAYTKGQDAYWRLLQWAKNCYSGSAGVSGSHHCFWRLTQTLFLLSRRGNMFRSEKSQRTEEL